LVSHYSPSDSTPFKFRQLITPNLALKLEALQVPNKPYILWEFTTPDSVKACADMSDNDIGGFSHANLDFIPQIGQEPAHLRFSGTISNELPPGNAQIERTGYAAWRTEDRPPTMFGKSLWNVDPYAFLALRVKTDGRKYKVNVQTESLVYSDLHQHRLYARRPGNWETVLIKWTDFVRTNHGMVVEPQSEILKEKVRTIGLGLTDRLAGPFEMCISRIWATNGLTPEEVDEAGVVTPIYVPKDVKDSKEMPRENVEETSRP